MYYCGKNCQQKDWIQHKFECKVYKNNQLKAIEQTDDLFFRFVLRTYLYLINSPESFYERRQLLNDENSAVCLNDIINQELPSHDQEKINHFMYLNQQFKLLKIELDPVRMLKYHGICYEYVTKIIDYGMQQLGSGIYIAESQLKHSCSPSATTLFNNTQLVMRATRSIKSGEQITINNIISQIGRSLEWKFLPNFSFICKECALKCETYSFKKIQQLALEFISKPLPNDLNDQNAILKKILSMKNEICSECDSSLIFGKIMIMQSYIILHDIVEELSVAEMAKRLEIKLPAVYNEIFENVYFNREIAPISIMKALANVEFN
uniref:Histone-lysine N-methyltransferase SMYD3-like n=1 Tax=Dermatophagoides pteronyssinus TaxID=6956 RepID=A0A6P6YJ41_DERPT